MIIVIINRYHTKNTVRNEDKTNSSAGRRERLQREGSVEEFLMQRWHFRHQAKEKHTGLKGTQVVCVFMTLNIQRG